MNKTLKRLLTVLFCILSYLFFLSQSSIDRFVDDFENDETIDNATYQNYSTVPGDINIANSILGCPDNSVFYIENAHEPLIVRYRIYNASRITVSFYSSFGSFATKNQIYDLYHLGYNDNTDKTVFYPIYLYNGRMYMVNEDNKVYTSYEDIFFKHSFKEFGNEPDVSQLSDKLGVSISVGDEDNNLQLIDTSIETVEYMSTSGLYHHTVSGNIPEGTEYITVSLRDVVELFDDTDNVISGNQNLFSAIAKVSIFGNDLKFFDPNREQSFGSTLPYYPEESSSSKQSEQSEQTSESEPFESSSYESVNSRSSSPNIPSVDYSETVNQTYARRSRFGSGYDQNTGRTIINPDENNTAIPVSPGSNWSGTNVLQYVKPPSSEAVEEVDEIEEVEEVESDASSSEVSSQVQSSSQSSAVAIQSEESISSKSESDGSSNVAVIVTVIVASVGIIITQVVLYILKKRG